MRGEGNREHLDVFASASRPEKEHDAPRSSLSCFPNSHLVKLVRTPLGMQMQELGQAWWNSHRSEPWCSEQHHDQHTQARRQPHMARVTQRCEGGCSYAKKLDYDVASISSSYPIDQRLNYQVGGFEDVLYEIRCPSALACRGAALTTAPASAWRVTITWSYRATGHHNRP